VPVDKDATLEEFQRIAAALSVFRLASGAITESRRLMQQRDRKVFDGSGSAVQRGGNTSSTF
jgi:hypothetical protein